MLTPPHTHTHTHTLWPGVVKVIHLSFPSTFRRQYIGLVKRWGARMGWVSYQTELLGVPWLAC